MRSDCFMDKAITSKPWSAPIAAEKGSGPFVGAG